MIATEKSLSIEYKTNMPTYDAPLNLQNNMPTTSNDIKSNMPTTKMGVIALENLTVEQRIEKIKELAGDDIGVVINMHLEAIHVTENQGGPIVISRNRVYGNTARNSSDEGIMLSNETDFPEFPLDPTKYDIIETQFGTRYRHK